MDSFGIFGSGTKSVVARGPETWAEYARRHLKGELKRAGITYEELGTRLTRMGLPESKGSIAMKISRGAYPAWFLFAVMRAIDVQEISLNERAEPPHAD